MDSKLLNQMILIFLLEYTKSEFENEILKIINDEDKRKIEHNLYQI